MMKKFIISIFLLVAFLFVSIEFLFSNKKLKPFNFGPRYYIHRCGQPENTIEGAMRALQTYSGIECDIHFDSEKNVFILAHDWPDHSESVARLEDLLAHLPESALIWLDYKNAESSHLMQAEERLEYLIEKFNLQDRYFIESPHALHQMRLSWHGFNTSMWLRDYRKSRLAPVRRYIDKLAVTLGAHVAVSTSKEEFVNLKSTYRNFPKLIFTVNDKENQAIFEADPSIKVILKDLQSMDEAL